jgi:hypothetical protein
MLFLRAPAEMHAPFGGGAAASSLDQTRTPRFRTRQQPPARACDCAPSLCVRKDMHAPHYRPTPPDTHLYFHMPGALHVPFQQHAVISKRGCRFTSRRGQRVWHLLRRFHSRISCNSHCIVSMGFQAHVQSFGMHCLWCTRTASSSPLRCAPASFPCHHPRTRPSPAAGNQCAAPPPSACGAHVCVWSGAMSTLMSTLRSVRSRNVNDWMILVGWD